MRLSKLCQCRFYYNLRSRWDDNLDLLLTMHPKQTYRFYGRFLFLVHLDAELHFPPSGLRVSGAPIAEITSPGGNFTCQSIVTKRICTIPTISPTFKHKVKSSRGNPFRHLKEGNDIRSQIMSSGNLIQFPFCLSFLFPLVLSGIPSS